MSSETIDSLAAKLADFADALSEDERHALDLFFLQPSDVEGFGMAAMNMQVIAPIDGKPRGIVGPADSPLNAGLRTQLYRGGIIAVLIG